MLTIDKEKFEKLLEKNHFNSQAQFAKKIGLPQTTLSSYCTGKRTLPMDKARLFADVLNCDVYDLAKAKPFDYDFTSYFALKEKVIKMIDFLTEDQLKAYYEMLKTHAELNEKLSEELYCNTTDEDI